VPAAAVIHEWQALSVIIGRKGRVDGKSSYTPLKQIIGICYKTFLLEFRRSTYYPYASDKIQRVCGYSLA